MNTEIQPTITADTITAVLHKRADQNLRARIALQIPAPADNRGQVTLPDIVVENLKHTIEKSKAWLPYILEAAREGLFCAQVEAARAAEVAEFLAKVETTAAELDAIREEMHQ